MRTHRGGSRGRGQVGHPLRLMMMSLLERRRLTMMMRKQVRKLGMRLVWRPVTRRLMMRIGRMGRTVVATHPTVSSGHFTG